MEWTIVFTVFITASFSNALAETCQFNHSIGLADGTFGEKELIASTFLDVYHSPNWARLNQPSSWAPALLSDTLRLQEFVQITFVDGPYLVTGVSIQGSPLEDWWVTKFQIATSNNAQSFHKDPQEYDGNSDRSSIVVVPLYNPTPSVYFRVFPTAWNNYMALRLELHGCDDFSV